MKCKLNLSDEWIHLCEKNHDIYIIACNGLLKDKNNEKNYYNLFQKLKSFDDSRTAISFLEKDEYFDLTLIYITDSYCLLKSDFIRFYTIFYTLKDNELIITDRFPSELHLPLNSEALIEFMASGHVYNNKTIFNSLCALQTAEIVLYEDSKLSSSRYFSFITENKPAYYNETQIGDVAKKSDEIFRSIFNELKNSISHKTSIVVPLSGGHDSRMIVNYLKKTGFKNVICYSYGVSGNPQSEISKLVAEAAGYPWHFIEYTEEKWDKLHEDGEIDRFIDFSFRGTGNPHLQDFLAVSELKKKGIVNKGDIFIPGHGLDTIVGDDEGEAYNGYKEHDEAVKGILRKFSRNYDHIGRKFDLLHDNVSSMFEGLDVEPRFYNDYFAWQERQAKFIINSLRVYEFFGFEGRVPFCDIRLVRLWLSVDLLFKSKRIPYFVMEKEYFLLTELRDIPYAKGRPVSKESLKIKSLIPLFIKSILARLLKRKSIQGEGLNMIYSLQGDSVGEIIGPIKKWPKPLRKYFKDDLKRYPFQINHHFLTQLYTLKQVLNKNRSN